MNMLGHASMAPPPAPQPIGLRRLRIVGAALLLLSALSVAFIPVIAAISIYAVAVVIVVMIAAIVVTAIYWIKRNAHEKAYWTDERHAAYVDGAVNRLRGKSAKRRL